MRRNSGRIHCGLMSANATTFAHLSVSLTMNFAKSAGAPAKTAQPRSTKRCFIAGSARAALMVMLSLSTISLGVPPGRDDAIPAVRRVARQKLRHGGDIGQELLALGRRDAQRAQFAGPDIAERRGHDPE